MLLSVLRAVLRPVRGLPGRPGRLRQARSGGHLRPDVLWQHLHADVWLPGQGQEEQRSSHHPVRYSGFSFPIGKTGIRYRVGGARGHSVVVGQRLQVDDTGTLSISSKRAVFIGNRKTIEMPYSKLVNLSVYTDGVQFHLSNR